MAMSLRRRFSTPCFVTSTSPCAKSACRIWAWGGASRSWPRASTAGRWPTGRRWPVVRHHSARSCAAMPMAVGRQPTMGRWRGWKPMSEYLSGSSPRPPARILSSRRKCPNILRINKNLRSNASSIWIGWEPAAQRWTLSPATANAAPSPSASAFSACVTVDRRPGGQVVVEGRLRGKIVQACVLTLDPVAQDLDETFRIVFKKDLLDERDPESGEAVVSAQADAPEPLTGNLLDVGEIVAEQLSLAADPYPRRPGAKLEDVLPKPRREGRRGHAEQRRHPFAGLTALRDKDSRGR